MIAWTLFIGSLSVLLLMFVRRLRMTSKDLMFQKHLADEEAAEQEVEEHFAEVEEQEEYDKPKGSTRQLFMKGDTHFSRGELDEAEPLFLAVVELDGNHLDAHHKLIMLYMKRADFPQAELYFSKLTNLKKDPVYFSNLGASLFQQQRLVEAAEAYENAIALDDKRAARLQSLAQVYYELENDEKALKYFELASRRKPKDNELRMILVDYYERLEQLEKATKVLNKILEQDPYNKEAKLRLNKL